MYVNVNFSFPRLGTQYFLGNRHIFTIRFEQHEFKKPKLRKLFFFQNIFQPDHSFEKFSHNMK